KAMTKDSEDQERRRLVAEIGSMAERLGKRLYRGLLKSVAMVWRPEDIKDLRLLDQVAADMQSAQAGLERLHCLAAESGPESLRKVLYSFALRSVEEIATLERL